MTVIRDNSYSIERILEDLDRYQYNNTSLTNSLENHNVSCQRRTPSEIKLNDLGEVIANRRLIDGVSFDWMWAVFHGCRVRRVGYDEEFLPNIGMLLFARTSSLERLCRCGQNGARCKLRSWCPRCAFAEATNLWKTYLPNFNKGSFWFLTPLRKG